MMGLLVSRSASSSPSTSTHTSSKRRSKSKSQSKSSSSSSLSNSPSPVRTSMSTSLPSPFSDLFDLPSELPLAVPEMKRTTSEEERERIKENVRKSLVDSSNPARRVSLPLSPPASASAPASPAVPSESRKLTKTEKKRAKKKAKAADKHGDRLEKLRRILKEMSEVSGVPHLVKDFEKLFQTPLEEVEEEKELLEEKEEKKEEKQEKKAEVPIAPPPPTPPVSASPAPATSASSKAMKKKVGDILALPPFTIAPPVMPPATPAPLVVPVAPPAPVAPASVVGPAVQSVNGIPVAPPAPTLAAALNHNPVWITIPTASSASSSNSVPFAPPAPAAPATVVNPVTTVGTNSSTYWNKGTGYGFSGQSTFDYAEFERRRKERRTKLIALNDELLSFLQASASSPSEQMVVYVALLYSSCLTAFLASELSLDSMTEILRNSQMFLSVLSVTDCILSTNAYSTLFFITNKPGAARSSSIVAQLKTLKRLAAAAEKLAEVEEKFAAKNVSQKMTKEQETEAELNKKLREKILAVAKKMESVQKKNEKNHTGMMSTSHAVIVQNIQKNDCLGQKPGIFDLQISVDGKGQTKVQVQEKEEEKKADKAKTSSTPLSLAPAPSTANSKNEAVTFTSTCAYGLSDYIPLLKRQLFQEMDGFPTHHFESSVNFTPTRTTIRRLGTEYNDLRNSLPLTPDSSVFLRVHEGKMVQVKFLVLAPPDTPYGYGAFLFDAYFPSDYPNTPPKVNLMTTGKGSVRFNPNLYNEGKVCLSLLGTWSGAAGENWSAATSTFLQVCVSIQSLIFVSEPYFNEPGYERNIGTDHGKKASRDYNKRIEKETLAWAIIDMMKNPPKGFEDVLQTHFAINAARIVQQCEKWATDNEGVKTQMATLKEELGKMKVPQKLVDDMKKKDDDDE